MNQQEKKIHYVSSLHGLKQLHQLVAIALKAHGNNPSPVEIKLELAALDGDNLMQMQEDLEQILSANQTITES
jgi:hypothetical protein